jgi:hypothetical protein
MLISIILGYVLAGKRRLFFQRQPKNALKAARGPTGSMLHSMFLAVVMAEFANEKMSYRS